ncbi:MAG: hypothetical protein JWM33_2903 [Caulobacteraceae bacterium]|nr:hypothetical protein [Caulobacteraceae bacterium]
MALTHSDTGFAAPRRAKPKAAAPAKTKTLAPHAREATPEHLADGDSIMMVSPINLNSKRVGGKKTLLYAIPVVIVLGAAAWLAVGGGANTTPEPGTAANPVSAAVSSQPLPADTTPASDVSPAVTSTASAPSPSRVAPIRRAATPAPAASASDTGVNSSAIEPMPVDQLAASVASAPAELVQAPAVALAPAEAPVPAAAPAGESAPEAPAQ